MAYLRYGPDSDWYVFWYSDKTAADGEARSGRSVSKEETRVAVWHAAHRAAEPIFTYREVHRMLETEDFASIPGFEPSALGVLRVALAQFMQDVDLEFDAKPPR